MGTATRQTQGWEYVPSTRVEILEERFAGELMRATGDGIGAAGAGRLGR